MGIFRVKPIDTDFGIKMTFSIPKWMNENIKLHSIDERTFAHKWCTVIDYRMYEAPTTIIKCSVAHICATNEHLIWTLDGWKQAKDIKVDDKIYMPNGSYAFVTEIQNDQKVREVYDFKLDGGTNFLCSNLIVRSWSDDT